MRFRPCIDIHNGKVKQIVGSSLTDAGDQAEENFIAEQDAAFYARMYARDGLTGGHVILLNGVSSPCYEQTKAQALLALGAAPGTLQAGGGITPENAALFLDAGATHVIVTSYVFRDGLIDLEALTRLVRAVGKERLVLDVSCRKKDGAYYVVTNRWQTFSDTQVTEETLLALAGNCDEFLVHAVDVEGKQAGPDEELVQILAGFAGRSGVPVTYAGGIGSFADLDVLREAGRDLLDVTIGSALDLFGGPMPYDEVLRRLQGRL